MAAIKGVRGRRAQAERPLALETHRQFDGLRQLFVIEVENRQHVLGSNARDFSHHPH